MREIVATYTDGEFEHIDYLGCDSTTPLGEVLEAISAHIREIKTTLTRATLVTYSDDDGVLITVRKAG